MKVLRLLLAAAVLTPAAAWAAIAWTPDAVYTPHVPLVLGGGVVALLLLTAVALFLEDRLEEGGKRLLMSAFLLAVLVPTGFTVVSYVHGVQTSWSDGEVHYHADYEVLVQDESGAYHQLDLISPEEFCQRTTHESAYMCRLNDRTGATEFHEHDDRRIHLEGTFKHREDATLSAFFETFNGTLTNERLVYPTNDRTWEVADRGDRTLKILVQRGVGGTRHWCAIGSEEQVAAEDVCHDPYIDMPARSPSEYVISPYQRGPSLDDIWIIYDDATVAEALDDLRADGDYKQFTQEKTAGAGAR